MAQQRSSWRFYRNIAVQAPRSRDEKANVTVTLAFWALAQDRAAGVDGRCIEHFLDPDQLVIFREPVRTRQ